MVKLLPPPIYIRVLAVVLSVGAGVVAQNLPGYDDNNNQMTPSFAAIGFVVGGSALIVFLFCLCCGLRHRRVQRASKAPYVPLPLVPPLSPYTQPYPPQPYNRTSEYPNAEVAPPPYVKEGAPLTGYMSIPPAGPPPPGIYAAYSPMYSPPPVAPPRAHISPKSHRPLLLRLPSSFSLYVRGSTLFLELRFHLRRNTPPRPHPRPFMTVISTLHTYLRCCIFT
ncbi:hypothetical protein B0H11DRAFT_2295208 [Mycena galericulata]|nr:hypothetical protein B0H11DRAFT_2295208 [Mycena galericulata]